MKIIFDSEEQKEAMMKLLADDYCPSVLHLKEDDRVCGNADDDCENCWKNCGIEMEVKEECLD